LLTTGVSVSYEAVENEKGSEVPVALLIIVLVIVWLLAIGGIVLLFLFKKKKIASVNAMQKEAEEKTDAPKKVNDTVSGIADLFEEAEKNSK